MRCINDQPFVSYPLHVTFYHTRFIFVLLHKLHFNFTRYVITTKVYIEQLSHADGSVKYSNTTGVTSLHIVLSCDNR